MYVCLIYWNILFKISHFNRKSRINNKRNDVIIHQNPFKVTTLPSKIVKSRDFTQNCHPKWVRNQRKYLTLRAQIWRLDSDRPGIPSGHMSRAQNWNRNIMSEMLNYFSEYLKLYFMTFTILNLVMTSQSDHADLPQNVIFSLKLQLL